MTDEMVLVPKSTVDNYRKTIIDLCSTTEKQNVPLTIRCIQLQDQVDQLELQVLNLQVKLGYIPTDALKSKYSIYKPES